MTATLEERRWTAMRSKSLADVEPFVIGVRTTGIFCRVGCPARSPHPENVKFYNTIGEAQDDGLRGCKRCHPEEGDLTLWRRKADVRSTVNA